MTVSMGILHLWNLARKPTADEMTAAKEFFAMHIPEERAAAAQALMWALLNSRDFLMNH